MAHLWLDELIDKHIAEGVHPDESSKNNCWGEASAVLYAMAFLTDTQRKAFRILIETYGDSPRLEHASIAGTWRDISEFASCKADEWDDSAEVAGDAE